MLFTFVSASFSVRLLLSERQRTGEVFCVRLLCSLNAKSPPWLSPINSGQLNAWYWWLLKVDECLFVVPHLAAQLVWLLAVQTTTGWWLPCCSNAASSVLVRLGVLCVHVPLLAALWGLCALRQGAAAVNVQPYAVRLLLDCAAAGRLFGTGA